MTLFLSAGADSAKKLNKTEILGKEYYVYDARKGESVYSIAKRFGWDVEELMRLNPDASSSLQKGSRLYYPTGNISVVTERPKPMEIDYTKLEPVNHKVKKGETIYSISRQYTVPLEVLYTYNPEAKKKVKQGDVIIIPQNANAQYYYYTVKSGDTLSSIAQQFNTTVEDILTNNAGLTANNLKEGETIRISINSNIGKVKTELVAEDRLTRISSYKVAKDESWEDISEKTGVDVDVLKEANDNNETPKDNSLVAVPIVETVEVEKTSDFESPKVMSGVEVQELYDSIKGYSVNEIGLSDVRMALILDEPNSKKDLDFTRGVLVALNEMKDSSIKIDLSVIDGRVSSVNLIEKLDEFEPNIIISTADRAFPLFLADYGNSNNIQVINVFDLKNDLYEDNGSIVQILPPSGIFNDHIASRIYQDNKRRNLIAIGEEDQNDGIAQELFSLYEGNNEQMSLEEFGSYDPDLTESYVFYSYAAKKEDVADFFNNMDHVVENYPGLDFMLVGRSSWFAMLDDFGDKFEDYNVYIPSRIRLSEDSPEWKSFLAQYEEMFDGIPVRSIPSYAASGYDMAKYFIPLVSNNRGDFNRGLQNIYRDGLQNDISLTRVNNWGGFINNNSYLLKFGPNGEFEKIIVK